MYIFHIFLGLHITVVAFQALISITEVESMIEAPVPTRAEVSDLCTFEDPKIIGRVRGESVTTDSTTMLVARLVVWKGSC